VEDDDETAYDNFHRLVALGHATQGCLFKYCTTITGGVQDDVSTFRYPRRRYLILIECPSESALRAYDGEARVDQFVLRRGFKASEREDSSSDITMR
jgi:hypothetical protein